VRQFPEPDQPAPTQEPPEQTPRRSRRLSVRYAAAAGVLVIAVAVALAVTLPGSSKPKHPTRTATSPSALGAPTTTPQAGPTGGAPLQSTTVAGTGPSADWLGMQIVTTPSGVVISSLRLGSPADAAGFEPGDVIDEIDDHQINSVAQLRSVTASVRLGGLVQIQVLRSSVMVKLAAVPMKERPTIHP
jgi:membrane-associated protease RseP (regulator of RpoE activity)